jgi:hypothetical protein
MNACADLRGWLFRNSMLGCFDSACLNRLFQRAEAGRGFGHALTSRLLERSFCSRPHPLRISLSIARLTALALAITRL